MVEAGVISSMERPLILAKCEESVQ
jgi:hypothetical protein